MKTGITKLVVVFAAVAVLGSGYIVENETPCHCSQSNSNHRRTKQSYWHPGIP